MEGEREKEIRRRGEQYIYLNFFFNFEMVVFIFTLALSSNVILNTHAKETALFTRKSISDIIIIISIIHHLSFHTARLFVVTPMDYYQCFLIFPIHMYILFNL